jgi:hypothetical protein
MSEVTVDTSPARSSSRPLTATPSAPKTPAARRRKPLRGRWLEDLHGCYAGELCGGTCMLVERSHGLVDGVTVRCGCAAVVPVMPCPRRRTPINGFVCTT